MKNQILFLAFLLSLVAFSCKQNAPDPKEPEAVTTEAPQDNTMVEAPVDSNLVNEELVEQHAQVKGTNTTKHKKQGKKMVAVDSDPAIAAPKSEVKPAPAKTPATKSTTTKAPTAKPTAPAAKPVPLVDAEGYFYESQYKATYPGGEAALDQFLDENLRYPPKAMDANIEGTVYVELYVDEKGNIVKALFPGKKLGMGIEDEVKRVVKLMPKWAPGVYDNTFVKSRFVVPIRFDLK